jgi:hypothetical protein
LGHLVRIFKLQDGFGADERGNFDVPNAAGDDQLEKLDFRFGGDKFGYVLQTIPQHHFPDHYTGLVHL